MNLCQSKKTTYVLSALVALLSAGSCTAAFAQAASDEHLYIHCSQPDRDVVKISASNSFNQQIIFTAKVAYTYETLMGSRRRESKTVSGSLGANQMDENLCTITASKIQVSSVSILSDYTP